MLDILIIAISPLWVLSLVALILKIRERCDND